MPQEIFKTRIIGLARITIPSHTRKFLNLQEGDWVEVAIQKVSQENKKRTLKPKKP